MEKKNRLRAIKIGGIVIFNLICLFSIIYCLTTSAEKNPAISGEEVKVISEFEAPQKPVAQSSTKQTAPAAARPQAVQPASAVSAAPAAVKTESVSASSAAMLAASIKPTAKVFIIDDFQGDEVRNKIGSKANVYVRAPSRIMISKRSDIVGGKNIKALMIRYDKKNTGGPNGSGGWCGYYTLTKNEKTGQYFDASDYKYITFWVKGDKGGENFMVGLADEHWDRIGDSLKSEEIGTYIDGGKITAQWQRAKVPLDIFFLDHATISAVTINFEAECFPEGAGEGTVFISDIAFEK